MNLGIRGVELIPIQKNHLEKMRRWRNHPEVRKYMFYQKEISEKEHSEWYQHLDKEKNRYFVVSYKENEIGVANLKNIDFHNKNAEAGLYISETSYQNNIISILALVVLYQHAFEVLRLKKLFGRVLASNSRALKLNEEFGFKSMSTDDSRGEIVQELTIETYQDKSSVLFKKLKIENLT